MVKFLKRFGCAFSTPISNSKSGDTPYNQGGFQIHTSYTSGWANKTLGGLFRGWTVFENHSKLIKDIKGKGFWKDEMKKENLHKGQQDLIDAVLDEARLSKVKNIPKYKIPNRKIWKDQSLTSI